MQNEVTMQTTATAGAVKLPAMDLTVWNNESKAVDVSNEKTKCAGARLMRPKEYREAFGVKGQQARKDYRAYLAKYGVVPKQMLSALLADPDVIVTGMKDWNKSKFQFSGARLAPVEADEPAKPLTETEADELARLRAENTALKASQPKS